MSHYLTLLTQKYATAWRDLNLETEILNSVAGDLRLFTFNTLQLIAEESNDLWLNIVTFYCAEY